MELSAVGIRRCVDSRLEMDKIWNMESLENHNAR